MSIAEKLKEDGNTLFKQKKYKEANNKFLEAVEILEKQNQNEIKQPTHPHSKLYLNLLTNSALCYLNLKQVESYEKAITISEKALFIEPENLKALYRRGLAYKQLGEKLELQNHNDPRLFDLYKKAKEDLEKLTLLDRKNEVAEQKLSETVKNFYRVRLMEKTKQQQQKVQEVNAPAKLSEQAIKKAKFQTQAMEKIMKQYKVQEVAKAAHTKIENQLLAGPLPKTRTQFEKAVKTLEKNKQSFCKFILKLDGKYYSSINPNFDTLYKLLMALCEPQAQKLPAQQVGNALLAISQCNSYKLLQKSLIASQKKKVQELVNRISNVESLAAHLKKLKLA